MELLRHKRAEGHFAGTGLEQYFQIYDFSESQMAASLKRLGIARNGTYLCLTQLDAQARPVKISWRIPYASASDALAALDSQLGLNFLAVTPSSTPSPGPTKAPERLSSGSELPAGSMVESPSAHFRFAVQTDGNCVFYRVDGGIPQATLGHRNQRLRSAPESGQSGTDEGAVFVGGGHLDLARASGR